MKRGICLSPPVRSAPSPIMARALSIVVSKESNTGTWNRPAMVFVRYRVLGAFGGQPRTTFPELHNQPYSTLVVNPGRIGSPFSPGFISRGIQKRTTSDTSIILCSHLGALSQSYLDLSLPFIGSGTYTTPSNRLASKILKASGLHDFVSGVLGEGPAKNIDLENVCGGSS